MQLTKGSVKVALSKSRINSSRKKQGEGVIHLHWSALPFLILFLYRNNQYLQELY